MPDEVAGELHSIGRAAPLRAHLDADDRVPDGRRAHPARHRRASRRRRRRASTSTFQATGRTIEFPGYLRAYVEGADDPDAELEDREAILPALAEADPVECQELHASGHATQPPARYTEASLVKELEERGIGRPSTYAVVLDTLLRRDYVWKKGNALVPDLDRVRQDAAARAVLRAPHRLRVHRDDGGGARRHRARRGRSREVVALLLLRERRRRSARPLHRGPPRDDRRRRGERGADRPRRRRPRDHRAGLVERRQRRARRREGARPRRPRPRRADDREGRGADRQGRRRAARARRRPRHRTARARADRPVRPVRTARRDGRRLPRRSPSARRSCRPWTRRRSRSNRPSRCWRCHASSARATAR